MTPAQRVDDAIKFVNMLRRVLGDKCPTEFACFPEAKGRLERAFERSLEMLAYGHTAEN